MNKTIVVELKKRLGDKKGAWVDKLPKVLWAYRCTPSGTTDDTPFNHTYGTGAMLPVELGEPSLRWKLEDLRIKNEELNVELDTLDEQRDQVVLKAKACRRITERIYNTKVRPRSLKEGYIVWRKTGEARQATSHGNFAAKWEGPFRITEDLETGAYYLEYPKGHPIPNTWNASHLKFYFS